MMEISRLTDQFTDLWNQTSPTQSPWGGVVNREEKQRKELYVDTFLKSMKKLDSDLLKAYSESNVLDEFVLGQLRDLFQNAFSYEHEEIDLMFSGEMMNATKAFIKQAKKFDPSLSIQSIFQACRNVWIMTGLQLILGRRVELTPSIFAYSMLYPYTDNFVDDPQISSKEKQEFSSRFADRLDGKAVDPINEQEQKIYTLVSMIESQYGRQEYPQVFDSLLGIHQAQTQSMALFGRNTMSDDEAIRICLAKGGASVLADGYLIAGNLSEEEKCFLFGYGAYLQLLDDVQDVKEDLEDGLLTAFSKATQEQKLDAMIYKTYNFGEQVLTDSSSLLSRVALDFKGLLQKSILLFFVESVAVDKQFYTEAFQYNLEQVSPLSFSFVRDRHKFFTPQKHVLLEQLKKRVFAAPLNPVED
ncbi:class 1 isoprenoid biosynthesis enzyme [Sunxiuqinia sp. sy24]|uniref:class 1 isoprenoid biosynthesis enzyme n=1 Tax=Sunxiuqinia sp. sy24 TaxID=3461495 RepID=UPI00404610E7